MESKSENNKHDYDRFLPVANISRIIKNNLPKEIKLAKEAKETFQECLSEFISFITSEASEKCSLEKRKTINGDDVLAALSNLGFDHYNLILRNYLLKYRESQTNSIKEIVNKNENNNINNNNINYNINNSNTHNNEEDEDENDCNLNSEENKEINENF